VGSSDSLGTLAKTKIATVVDLFPKFGFDYRSVKIDVWKSGIRRVFIWKIFNIFLSVSSHQFICLSQMPVNLSDWRHLMTHHNLISLLFLMGTEPQFSGSPAHCLVLERMSCPG